MGEFTLTEIWNVSFLSLMYASFCMMFYNSFASQMHWFPFNARGQSLHPMWQEYWKWARGNIIAFPFVYGMSRLRLLINAETWNANENLKATLIVVLPAIVVTFWYIMTDIFVRLDRRNSTPTS